MKKNFALLSTVIFLALAITVSGCKKDADDPTVEICGNGIDDDNDGFVDYDDVDCTETGDECNNGVDDDGDGFIDANDFDCTETGDECTNGLDDDGDGFIDCDDLDCNGHPNC